VAGLHVSFVELGYTLINPDLVPACYVMPVHIKMILDRICVVLVSQVLINLLVVRQHVSIVLSVVLILLEVKQVVLNASQGLTKLIMDQSIVIHVHQVKFNWKAAKHSVLTVVLVPLSVVLVVFFVVNVFADFMLMVPEIPSVLLVHLVLSKPCLVNLRAHYAHLANSVKVRMYLPLLSVSSVH